MFAALLIVRRPKPEPLSFVFQRYSTAMDLHVEDVAFLWLTNASADKTYYLAMPGTNTSLRDAPTGFGPYKSKELGGGSHLVACEFSDRTLAGMTNWTEQGLFTSGPLCLTLQPHSAIRLRVPLPPQGQQRKVAALCAQVRMPSPFWNGRLGFHLRSWLPRSVQQRMVQPRFAVAKVWCPQELSRPDNSRVKH